MLARVTLPPARSAPGGRSCRAKTKRCVGAADLADLARADDAALVGEKILEALSAPICTAGHELGISCSIGISVYPEDGKDFATLMTNADMAMYHAKKKGGSFHFYMPEMRVPALDGPAHP